MTDPVERRRALQAERHADLEARVRRLLAPLADDERALDVGCGTGALAYVLAPLVGDVVGVDASEDYLAAARESAPEGCTFVTGDAEALPFPYGDFDLVGCLRVLHHVERPELVVSEIARVTSPGGRILLADQLGDIDPEQFGAHLARAHAHDVVQPAIAGVVTHVGEPADDLAGVWWIGATVPTAVEEHRGAVDG